MFEKINFALMLTNQQTAEMITQTMLNTGVFCHSADTEEKFFDILAKDRINCILLDFDFGDNQAFTILDKIRQNKNFDSILVLGTSFNTNEAFIRKIQSSNLVSFIVKPITSEKITAKIQSLINKFKDHFPERKHVRVQPDPDEMLRCSFQLSSKKLITAKIVDISLGGFAAEMYTAFEGPEMITGKRIEKITFMLNNREIQVDADIVLKKDKFFSVRFVNFYDQANPQLTRYITKKLSI